MKHIYLGRQPILNKKSEICAYEVLYRDSEKMSDISGDRYASASVITTVLNKFGTKKILGNRKAFIKIDEKFLLSDIIYSVPKEFFIFTLLESVEMSLAVVERVKELRTKGYLLALNDMALNGAVMTKYEEVLGYFDFFKVDCRISSDTLIQKYVKELQQYDIMFVATKIESHDEYEIAKQLGFDCFEGYYFAKPQILENSKYEPTQLDVLKLYNLLIVDTSIDEITTEFEKKPEITFQLLQFINSGAFHFKKKISSIHHVLTLLGRVTVAKWLMLMIYAKSVSKTPSDNPLMLMVRNRTYLMEEILKEIHPDAGSNMIGEAYFVGVLSLMDVVFNMRLEDILEGLNISSFVKSALLKNEGELGDIYLLVKDIEQFNVEKIPDFERRYNIESGRIQTIIDNMLESHI